MKKILMFAVVGFALFAGGVAAVTVHPQQAIHVPSYTAGDPLPPRYDTTPARLLAFALVAGTAVVMTALGPGRR